MPKMKDTEKENQSNSIIDYNGNKIESIYNLIYSSNENYSFKLIK